MSVTSDQFVESGGEVKIAKLVSTILGAAWLTFVTGLIGLWRAYARAHAEILRALEGAIVGVLTAYGEGGAETIRYGWGEAFRAAVETSPVFAPLIMSLELVIVSALLIWARRWWY